MSNSNKLAPRQVGYLLSAVGTKVADHAFLNETAVQTLKGVGYPLERFLCEARILGAFAAEWVIFRTLSQSPDCDEFRRGFWDGWYEAANSGVVSADFFDDYGARSTIYAKAAAKEEDQAPGTLGSPISTQLADFMTIDEDIEYGRESEIMTVAHIVGPAVFDAHSQAALAILVENGGLVRR